MRFIEAIPRRVLTVLLTACFLAGSVLPPVRIAVAGSSQPPSAPHTGVRIALIDTGVRVDRLPVGANVENGRNYAFEDKNTTDPVGHGTRIAGIILGIAPDITLVPLVYYSQYPSGVPVNGGIDAISRAIYDAIDLYDCKVVNVSSGVASDEPSLREAIGYAEEKGVIVVSAVGNDRLTAPDKLFYPAAYETVVGVGAVDAELSIAPFSQVNGSVTVVAPGKDLEVLTIKGGSPSETVSGTSYATAYVAAHAGLLISAYPDATPAEFRELLSVSSQDLGEPGFDETFGWGYVDAGSPSALLAYERMLRVKALPFSDVSLSDWYCDAVLAVYEKGLMLGESAAGFGPNSPVTLEMLCTVLHRLDDQPGRDEDSSSIDWAVQTGLFDVGDPGALDLSSPAARSGPVSREAVCTVLVEYGRYAGVEELAVPTNAATPLNTATFADIEQASDWARDYVRIAQAVGLISGDGDGFCRPLDTVSRAELATMLMRLLGLASPE